MVMNKAQVLEASTPPGKTPPNPGRAGPPAMIRVEGLGKRFKLYDRPADRLLEWASAGRIVRHKDFWALRDISFEVRRGECLGILGVNGSGKSTLLKIISGAMYPTTGRLAVNGRILSLIELGAGLNPQLTGRENILNSARLLNFPPTYARDRMEEIEAFAELGDFFERPTRLYSSGMRVRLAFSMFACFRPEIFVIDEALSVGDVFFQQKCVQRIDEMLASGVTMLFVSHDTPAIRRLAHRAIVLDRGRTHYEGGSDEAISRYFALVGLKSKYDKAPGAAADPGTPPARPASPGADDVRSRNIITDQHSRHGTGDLVIEAATVEDGQGRPTQTVEMMRPLTIRVLVRAARTVPSPAVGVHLYDRLGNLVFACGSHALGVGIPAMRAGEEKIVGLRITMSVQPGPYTFSLGCGESSTVGPHVGQVHNRIEGLGPIVVSHDHSRARPFYGIARLPMEIVL